MEKHSIAAALAFSVSAGCAVEGQNKPARAPDYFQVEVQKTDEALHERDAAQAKIMAALKKSCAAFNGRSSALIFAIKNLQFFVFF